jgi:hypothetical protein
MYEEQCESSIRLPDSELAVTAARPAVHGQLLLERATKHARYNRAYRSLALRLFVFKVCAFSVGRIGVLGRSRGYLVPQ